MKTEKLTTLIERLKLLHDPSILKAVILSYNIVENTVAHIDKKNKVLTLK